MALSQPATDVTAAANRSFAADLPLDDPGDLERLRTGRIAGLDRLVLQHDTHGGVILDTDDWNFLDGELPDSVNPSLWRQARLNREHGLYELRERIYQVRGYDISNLSLIEGDTGWIVIDPLTSTETARAAMDLVREHLGERPVVAVIYTHSHLDHFAGLAGVIDLEELRERQIPIVAPKGFLVEAVAENVIAGPAMMRRSGYMYGNHLERGPLGQVDCGLGRSIPPGSLSLVGPTHEVSATGEELVLDGVRIVFQFTPDAEAPAEMMFHFPELRAFCAAENCTSVMHNLYTLRGAQVRDALAWSKYINEALRLFGDSSDLVFASHGWPRFGAGDVKHYLRTQRDTYKYLHDQTMRLANQGFVATEIAEELDLPPSLAGEFGNRGYYGTVNHNAKAVYQRYLGWFDGNPAHLHPLPPEPAAKRYVEYMGGATAVLERARSDFDRGDYRWVAEVVNHVVFADPANTEARELQAQALEQLGYQAESGPWRNFYLTGAKELRKGTPGGAIGAGVRQAAPLLKAMTIEMVFDLLGVRLDGPRADGHTAVIGWRFPDIDEEWTLRLENAALNAWPSLDDDAEVVLTMPRDTLTAMLVDPTSIGSAVERGELTIDGDGDALARLFGLFDPPRPGFNIIEP
ncbi:MAG TPA: alkyl sulfatase dimerization domain-containing protein [Acidimicrobiales bacterium]|jgi:alkyl sulfatase BDS1-like metallo-beta-lactamase superfamily hydrolase|nr:alkyl sulfatase dimerization domain-containing protein [Acidimicrobiales bacterium]